MKKKYTLTESKLKNIIRESIKSVLKEGFDSDVDENIIALAEYVGCDPEEVVEQQNHFYEAAGQEWYVFDSTEDAEDYVMGEYDAAYFMESCWRDGQEFYEWLQKNPNSAAYYDLEQVFPDLAGEHTYEDYNEETGEYEEVEYDPYELGGFTDNVNWRYVAQVVLDVDGPQWYLAGYDGNEVELPNGAVAYRHN